MSAADQYYHKGEYRLAEEQYGRALEAQPALQPALLGIARCRIALGRPQEALSVLTQVLSQDSENRDARRELGHAFVAANLFARAEQILKPLLDSKPDDKETLCYFGYLMYQNGYYGAALDYLNRSVDLDSAPARLLRTEVYIAVCLARLGRNQDAEVHFQKLSEKAEARTEPDMLLVYAELLYETGRPEEALRRVDQALAANPNLAMGYFWRARLLLHLKRLPEAATAAERSLELIPELPFPRNLLIRIYQQMGRQADAARQAEWLQQYEQRLSKGPGGR